MRVAKKVLAGLHNHKGLNTNRVECFRETNFNEARTVNKGKFLYFLDLCVRKVNLLEQMAVVTSVCSDDFKNSEVTLV